jgi:two-component system NtrC family response regulator
MKAGAFDFITKPWNNAMLLQRIETALELKSMDGHNSAVDGHAAKGKNDADAENNKCADAFDRSFIIGNSKALNDVLDVVRRVADTNASVLITGESGTGKELIAEALHRNSNRKDKNFVKVNLGGLSSTLFESEMFGPQEGRVYRCFCRQNGTF